MQGPRCPLCGQSHWSREPHQFGKVEVNAEHTKKVLNQAAQSLGLKNAQRPLGIGHTESKSEGARRRGEQSTPSGACTQPKARDDTAEAPQTTNGADTNCRTLRTQARTPEGVPGSGGRGMNGQREVSRQGIVRPTNTSREGRRVLKAEAARPDATRSASTEKPDPPTPPPAKAGKQTKAAKVTPGERQTALKAKKKGKKK